jgi:hypothetical protein
MALRVEDMNAEPAALLHGAKYALLVLGQKRSPHLSTNEGVHDVRPPNFLVVSKKTSAHAQCPVTTVLRPSERLLMCAAEAQFGDPDGEDRQSATAE